MSTISLPWLDRAGRLSWLKLVTFILLFVPGLWIVIQLGAGWLKPKPITEALHQTGFWAVRFLLVSLAVTPLRRLGAFGKLIIIRRMLGVAVLAYAIIHLVLYVIDQHFDLIHVASEIVLRFYLTIGFIAIIGFAVLGSTSTDAMIRRLGAKRWNRLHKLVYVLGILALWHFLLQAKLDVTQPVFMAGLFFLLMGFRLAQSRGLGDSIASLVTLAALAAIGTAILEAVWYHVVNHVPIDRVLSANLDLDDPTSLSPAWWVLSVGAGMIVLRLCRRLWSKPLRMSPARPASRPISPSGPR